MDSVLTVTCVYKPGGGFSNEYVTRLKDAVQKHCTAPFNFVCLTNQKLPGIETRPLRRGLRGWWNKLELFETGQFSGPVVYFDLDTLILSNITDILTTPQEFACVSNWKGNGTHISSAIMAWDGRLNLGHIPAGFTPKLIEKYEQGWQRWGDQGYIQDTLGRPWTSLLTQFPGRIVHYKTHCQGNTKEFPGRAPKGSSIVCFSGKPRPHELNWKLEYAH
jgi:hypothetical protein